MSDPDLLRLRELLHGDETRRLDALEEALRARGDLAQELAALLPDAVTTAADTDPRLAMALQRPIREGVGRAVREDAEGFGEVLFPVMGPSIRRAIAEALKDFTRSLNYGIGRGLVWRVEAIRRGIPFSELVMERTMAYRVEQALLIQSATGLVISKAELSTVVAQDSDAFSAMLNVIQDFIRDSFSPTSQISTLDLGDRTVWITPGRHAHLACVISGAPGQRLRTRLADVIDHIHRDAAERLEHFHGDREGLEPIDVEVASCLEPDQIEREEAHAGVSAWPGVVLRLALLAGGLWWWLHSGKPRPEAAAAAVLDAAPGLHVTAAARQGERWRVSGLRDPLADAPGEILQRAGVPAERVAWDFEPYVSLDQQIVLRRARQSLRAPDEVTMALEGGVLRLGGRADPGWIAAVSAAAMLPPGVDALDVSAVEAVIDLGALRRTLAVPASVQMQLNDAGLHFAGAAPWSWMRSLRARIGALTPLSLAPAQALVPAEWAQARTLAASLDQRLLYFDEGIQLRSDMGETLAATAAELGRLRDLATELGAPLTITLSGYTDSSGQDAANLALRRARAEELKRQLGAAAATARIDPQPGYQAPAVPRAVDRRVALQVDLRPPAGGWL